MKIGFFDYCLNFRGTTRAILEYCKILMADTNTQDCTVFFEKNNKYNALGAAKLFIENGISVQPMTSRQELFEKNLDFLYHVTSGDSEWNAWIEQIPCKNVLIHQVGYQPPFQTNHKFAYTSHWQSYFLSGLKADVLPYIVNVNSTNQLDQCKCRESLGIPQDAIVLGRLGGQDTWNLGFVNDVVQNIASTEKNIYFIFLNTPKFMQKHERVIFLDGTHDGFKIDQFFSVCDVMLHARWEGETFGMACAEFLFRGKPIITWSESRERNHILMADRSLISYNGPEDLGLIIKCLNKDYLAHKSSLIDLRLLRSLYSPNAVEPVLRKFLHF